MELTLTLADLRLMADTGTPITPKHQKEILGRLIQSESDLAALAVNGKKVCEILGIIDARGKSTGKSATDITMGAVAKLANPFTRTALLKKFEFLGDMVPLIERYGHLADEPDADPGNPQ